MPIRQRGTARLIGTNLMRPWQQTRAARLLDREPVLLHIGSGSEYKAGWANIDLAMGDRIDLAWNLVRRLPFPDNSVHGAFSEHVLEHLSLEQGLRLLAECRRVLLPDAVLRTGVPDAGRWLHSYAGDGDVIETLRPGRPTRMLAVQELFYWHRHQTMYDAETLGLVLEAAGLRAPIEVPFGQTALPLCPDTPRRAAETLYMEARA